MRFSMARSYLTPQMVALGISTNQLVGLSQPLKAGINAAYHQVVERGAAYSRWFGGMEAQRGVVLNNMTLMRDFANSGATVSLMVKADGPYGDNSAYVFEQGRRSLIGQYILNLGADFGSIDNFVTNININGYCLLTIAHELSHLVFGANQNPPAPAAYLEECYRADALNLAAVDPAWASWNAENYGYFIEQCC